MFEMSSNRIHPIALSTDSSALVLEAGEASRENREGQDEVHQAQVSCTVVEQSQSQGGVRLIRIQEAIQETTTNRRECEWADHTDIDEGTHVHVSRVTKVERHVYMRIVDTLYLSTLHEMQESAVIPAVEATRLEKTLDYGCQSIECSFRSPFRMLTRADIINAKQLMNPVLRRGRVKGMEILQQLVVPFISDVGRAVWIIMELITILIAFALSAASFSLGKNEIFNAFHLALTILSTVLAILDAVVNLGNWRSCSCCRSCSEQLNNTKSSCGKCLVRSKSISDFARMVCTELILYPLLICDIFDKGYQPGNSTLEIMGFILFLVPSVSMVFYVYILRLVILAYAIKTVQRYRSQVINNLQDDTFDDTSSTASGRFRNISNYMTFSYRNHVSSNKSGLHFQIHFFIHVFAQMIAQIFMLIAIGAKIEYENRNHESIQVSNHLWYRLVAGYILPICGLLTFFLITYYWTQQFPVGICVDLISILEVPGCDHIFFPRKSMKECTQKLAKVAEFVNRVELEREFKLMHCLKWYRKFFYPMLVPVIIILCIVYTAFQLAFIVCATYAVDPETKEMTRIVLSDGLGWNVYYGLNAAVCILVNLYVFVTACFWSLNGAVVIVALVVAVIIYVPYALLNLLDRYIF